MTRCTLGTPGNWSSELWKATQSPQSGFFSFLFICCPLYLHHEAEEGGEAVQGGVEELPTGLITSMNHCKYNNAAHTLVEV